LDVVDPKFFLQKFMDFSKDYELVEEIEKSKKWTVLTWPLIELEYETFNPFLNMGGILVAFFAYITQILIYFLIFGILKLFEINKGLKERNKMRLEKLEE
jgi:hypothetical protein